MMESRATTPYYGVMAEFESPEALLEAAARARDAGYRKMDAFHPFPIHGMREALGKPKTKFPWIIFLGGAVGFIAAYSMMYFATVIHWPLNIGGRPLHSWVNYIPILFEVTVLFATLTAFFGLWVLCGLPMPYHPVFNVPRFARASTDRFFLCIEATDPKFDLQATRDFLQELNPASVNLVDH
jgi:hypothetical protein